MNLIRVFIYLGFIIFFSGCNTTEQKSLKTASSKSSDTSIKSASFIYNVSEIILTENTTGAHFIPVAQFAGAFFKVLPTLPAGLSLNTTSGEISGTPTETLVETQFLVEATTTDGVEYAFLNITVLPEPPKSLNYGFTTLQFEKGLIGSFTPTTTGGTISNFSVSPVLPNGLLLNATTGAIETIEVTPGVAQTEPGSSFHTITGSNTSGQFSTTVLIHIKDAPPVGLSYIIPSQDYIIGVSGAFNTMVPSFPLTSLERTPSNITYTIFPALPDGVELKADGSIQGTPEESIGFSNFTVTARSETGSSSTIVTLNIIEPSISLSYPSPAPLSGFRLEQNVAMSPIKVLSYIGGKPPTYSAGNCTFDTGAGAGAIACPAWLKLDPVTGLLSGKPDTIGILTVDITASHPDNLSALVGTPAAPSTTINFNIVENGPDDSNNIGYKSSYTITENAAINITPSAPGGNPSIYTIISGSLPDGVIFTNGVFTGIPNLNSNGTSVCATSSGGEFVLTIEGSNLDETNTPTQTGVQIITLKLIPQIITKLGFTEARSGTYFKNGVFELIDGTIISENIAPNGLAGGAPTQFSVTPRLPNGLSLDPCTGVISGKPQEILPIKNYTITAINSASSFNETIAISTNTLVKPTSLFYNDTDCASAPDGDNNLVFQVFTNQSETNCYVGSAATFTITPTLPLGLSLNSKTGTISGTPLTTNDNPGGNLYTIRATNILGFTEANVTIDVDNIALISSDISYFYNNTSLGTLELTEGDVLSPGDLSFQVVNNTIQSGIPTSFSTPTINGTNIDITSTPVSSAPPTLASANTRNLNFNSTTGDFTTLVYLDNTNNDTATSEGIQPTDFRELNPVSEVISLTMNNDILTPAAVSFNLLVTEKPLAFDYADGTNTINFTPDTTSLGDFTTGAATHTGGAVALTDGGVVTALCTATLLSSTSTVGTTTDKDLVNSPGTGLSLDVSTCDIDYDGSICSSSVLVNAAATGNATLEYSILAKNSGSPIGITKNITINYFDRPNFLFEPGGADFSITKYAPKTGYSTSSDEFEASKVLNLDANTTATSAYTPNVLGRCHKGNFELDVLSDLPTPITFSATDGTIENSGDAIVGRRFFNLISTETDSGLNFSQQENIAVQANYTIDNSAIITRTLSTTKFDLNLDGLDDLIIRNEECDDKNGDGAADGPCAPASIETSIYLQNSVTPGLLNSISPAQPALKTLNSVAIRPIIYDSNEAGILYVTSNNTDLGFRSMTSLGTNLNSSLTSSGFSRGIAVNNNGVSSRIGVIIDNGSSVAIDQFKIDSTPTLSPSEIRTVPIDGLTKLIGTGNAASSAGTTVTFTSPIPNFSKIQVGDIFFDGATDRTIMALTDSSNIIVDIAPGITSIDTWRIESPTASGGGIDLSLGGAIDIVEQSDIDGDGDLDIIIAYFDATDSKSKICGVAFDGSFYANECTPRLEMPGNGRIKDIKFANVTGDFLDEILVLVNDGSTNTIYIYENKSITSNIAGFYQLVDLMVLNSNSSFARFDVSDLNGDSFPDIIANDIFGDVDRDGTADSILSGFTIYYNSNLASNLFSNAVSDQFPTLFHYPNSAGDTNDIEVLNFGTEKLLLHCQIDSDAAVSNLLTGDGTPTTASSATNSSCGIIGSF